MYGWPIAKEGRLDVIAANNRSSTILDMVVDSPSTSLYTPSTVDAPNAVVGKGSDGVTFDGKLFIYELIEFVSFIILMSWNFSW